MVDNLNPCLTQAHTAESRALNVPNAIPPGTWLGMPGGGQLGRIFMYTIQAMGHKVYVLDPNPNSPADTIVERHLCTSHTDEVALTEMATLCPVVTTEFENMPVQTLDRLEQLGALVASRANCALIAQNRIAEKRFFALCTAHVGIYPVPGWMIEHEADIEQLPADLLPGILKIAHMDYGGKGQACVSTIEKLWAV